MSFLGKSRIYRGEFFAFQSCGRTAITYIDSNAYWHRCNKGDPEQVDFSVLHFKINP